jgi:hypothetical protein
MDGRTGTGVINLVESCRLGVLSPVAALGFRMCFWTGARRRTVVSGRGVRVVAIPLLL